MGICYGDGSYEQGVCPEWRLATTYYGGVSLARLVFAIIVSILCIAYIGFAARAVHKTRMARRQQRGGPVTSKGIGSDQDLNDL